MSAIRAEAPPVVLLGAQRSGTTALASVLDAAFDSVGGVFTINGKLPYFLHRWCGAADLRSRHLRVDEILHALHRKKPYGRHSSEWLARTEQVLRTTAAEVADQPVTDPVGLRRDIVRQCYAGASRFGDKYNEYLLELDSLAETIPDALWVLLIRHPAAVADSMTRWRGDRPWRPAGRDQALAKWAAWHEPWLAHPRTHDGARCVVVEYGRLCEGEDLRRLSEAIDLDLVPYSDELVERRPRGDLAIPPGARALWADLLDRRAT
ncbi:sulfotransferase [Allokutzneria sp. A3M-2-11 16]|uniref:sulfotransferase n=1 Tax=Allokutzneria sp. A3M-2-11 16 TaxID=2962043 RepID=UPI0020B88625|nr:sulfotransferase [Allokutzneria sp. A3M-2-11 16]MCP3798470.1 sulfotransferase [Allokutzneria sp. A3M-2-11 16]